MIIIHKNAQEDTRTWRKKKSHFLMVPVVSVRSVDFIGGVS